MSRFIRPCAVLILIGSVFFTALPAEAQTVTGCSSLTRTLKLGSSGADVKILQQILNQDIRTQVAASGPGSKGAEGRYFGAATKRAVIKFQNLYASSVLSPAGLKVGSGVVGGLSRAKLIALCKSNTTVASVAPTAPTTISTNLDFANFPQILKEFGITEYSTQQRGSYDSVSGKSFTTATTSFVFNGIKKSTTTTFAVVRNVEKDSPDVTLSVVEPTGTSGREVSYSCKTTQPGLLTSMMVLGSPSSLSDLTKNPNVFQWSTSAVLYLWDDEVDGLPKENRGSAVSKHNWVKDVKYAYCSASYQDGRVLYSKLIPVSFN